VGLPHMTSHDFAALAIRVPSPTDGVMRRGAAAGRGVDATAPLGATEGYTGRYTGSNGLPAFRVHAALPRWGKWTGALGGAGRNSGWKLGPCPAAEAPADAALLRGKLVRAATVIAEAPAQHDLRRRYPFLRVSPSAEAGHGDARLPVASAGTSRHSAATPDNTAGTTATRSGSLQADSADLSSAQPAPSSRLLLLVPVVGPAAAARARDGTRDSAVARVRSPSQARAATWHGASTAGAASTRCGGSQDDGAAPLVRHCERLACVCVTDPGTTEGCGGACGLSVSHASCATAGGFDSLLTPRGSVSASGHSDDEGPCDAET
jgi:hypothetical protein